MKNEIKNEKNSIPYGKIKNNFESKWINLKNLLREKSTFESSVKLLKTTTIDKFISNCCDIYKEKIQINILAEKNKQIFSTWKKNKGKDIPDSLPNILVKKDLSDLCEDSCIKDFLFYFRENNEYMLELINCVKKEKRKDLVPFLCHFFYENFFMENQEQEELLYLIYLLMEKEVDNLDSPSVLSFLDNSFLGDFLYEMSNKYEIRNYIDIVLNSLIREIEEKNSFYNSLDIIYFSKKHSDYYINKNSFFDMSREGKFSHTMKIDEIWDRNTSFILDRNSSFINDDSSCRRRTTTIINSNQSKNILNIYKRGSTAIQNKIKYETIPLKNLINKNFYNNIDENFLKKQLENEKSEIKKEFYIKLIKVLNSSNIHNFYNCEKYYEKMKGKKLISRMSIEKFNKSIDIVTTFINKLLKNLENKVIIPYIIKAICKFIYILTKKKFKNISKMQTNSLIFRFLFDKLILPVLENPDINNSSGKMIISINTRKNLINIFLVLEKLIRGELFNCEQNDNYTVFNKYILDNFSRMNNIIQNIIEVKIPEKLIKLSNQFYYCEDFCLEKVIRRTEDINYNYFDEHPNDFMQHKSICFNINQFLLFYGIIHVNQKLFIEKDSIFQAIFNNITKNIGFMKCGSYNYYVIIKENYNSEVEELLSLNEKKISLNKPKNKNEALYKLKYSISYLFSHLKISHHWEWLHHNYPTHKIFEFIHKYLTFYKDKSSPPLTWYTTFIINNLNSINNIYIENDYQLLFNEIENDIKILLYKLKKLNEFLTINMTTKFILIENRKKSYIKELENIKRTELNIKTLLFIESNDAKLLKICLLNGEEFNKYLDSEEKQINNDSIVICLQKNCPHKIMASMNQGLSVIEKKNLSYYHCKNVKEFAHKLSNFSQYITEEISYFSCGNEFYSSKKFLENNNNKDNLNNKKVIISNSPKKIFEIYMDLVSKEISTDIMFNTFQRSGFELINTVTDPIKNPESVLKMKREKEDREKVLNIIWNYILKSLCNKVYEQEPLFIDKGFNLRCISLSNFVKPINLHIPQELIEDNILKKINYHLEHIDELRTPGGMIEEFSMVVHLINSLYIFFLNQEQIEAGDLLPLIIYCIISVKPKRIIFDISFSKYFLSENELLGGIGYNMIQAESAINFIRKLEASQIGFTQEEFNEYCTNIKFNKKG